MTNGRIGAHIRTTGGLHRAFEYAKQWGVEVLQIFTSNPRQYALRSLNGELRQAYFAAREESGNPLVISHASYLVNLASPKEDVRKNAALAVAAELERCTALEIPCVILHIGAALDCPPETARELLVRELNAVTTNSSPSVQIFLETSAGQGTSIGRTFEEIAWILARLSRPERFGVCFDTCHVFAAGYDLRGDAYEATWAAFEAHIGLERLRVLHLNDSKADLGSCVDRHEHIGEGRLGIEPFHRLLNDPRLQAIPCFIETPDDLQYHAKNLSVLKSLVR